jgi:copper chaperone CopZ
MASGIPRGTRKLWTTSALTVVASLLPASLARAEDQQLKVRITGLFAPDRVKDLRTVIERWPDLKLTSIDFDRAEGVFEFDPAKVLPGAKPEQFIQRLDDQIRSASNGTFGVKSPSTTPKDKLTRVEIAVVGLDCKACCLAAYEIVAKIEGVEQATASFKEGRISALIDTTKTQKSDLESVLKSRGVTLKQP